MQGELSRFDVFAAYLRWAWLAVTIGVVGGAIGGGALFPVYGAVVAALTLLAAALPGDRLAWPVRAVVAVVAAATPSLLLSLSAAAPQGLLLAIALLMAVPSVTAAELHLARSRPVVAGTPIDAASAVAIVGGGILALGSAGATVALLRGGLRYGCEYGLSGEAAGSWHCVDGIGYVGAVLGLLACSGVALAAALSIVVSRRPRGWEAVTIAVLSFAPVVAAGLLTFLAVTEYARTFPPGVDPVEGWMRLVLPSLVVALAGLTLAAMTASSTSGPGVAIFSLGIVAIVVAVTLQLGMLLAYAPALSLVLAARSRFGYLRARREFDERAARFAHTGALT